MAANCAPAQTVFRDVNTSMKIACGARSIILNYGNSVVNGQCRKE